ncbi:hypothetical protein ACJRO7_033222 [Eucalyptus globulus]|uniref:Uncharacterized protein n=1 Tax=Eucalyptus globulus TaxID=34317 RepID=A0ABD3JS38_EUCGL
MAWDAPEYLVYHELILTAKEYMQCAPSSLWSHSSRPNFVPCFSPLRTRICLCWSTGKSKGREGGHGGRNGEPEEIAGRCGGRNKEEREKRAKQRQQVSLPGLKQGTSTYLRLKKFGL